MLWHFADQIARCIIFKLPDKLHIELPFVECVAIRIKFNHRFHSTSCIDMPYCE